MVFVDGTNDVRIAREEILSTVAAVTPSDTVEAAIAVANDSECGLSGGVFSPDTQRASAVGLRIYSGAVGMITSTCPLEAPFWGLKQRGIGPRVGAQQPRCLPRTPPDDPRSALRPVDAAVPARNAGSAQMKGHEAPQAVFCAQRPDLKPRGCHFRTGVIRPIGRPATRSVNSHWLFQLCGPKDSLREVSTLDRPVDSYRRIDGAL